MPLKLNSTLWNDRDNLIENKNLKLTNKKKFKLTNRKSQNQNFTGIKKCVSKLPESDHWSILSTSSNGSMETKLTSICNISTARLIIIYSSRSLLNFVPNSSTPSNFLRLSGFTVLHGVITIFKKSPTFNTFNTKRETFH